MRLKKLSIFSLILAIFIYGCGSGGKTTDNEASNTDSANVQENLPAELILTKVENSPKFGDAILTFNTPGEDENLPAGDVQFSFNVTNYKLAAQTEDADVKMCANSKDGQHIHLILNNEPYTAHYEAEFKKELKPGHYVALAFLSRSYHESLKQPEAYVLRQFTVGDVPSKEIDLTTPHMFYSRPKGTYVGADTKKIMLDFYLVNTTLSPDGNKVRATINGQEFMLTDWAPYFVEGLPMGENTFKLELLDKDGNLIDSPFNPVERTITLKEEEIAS